MSIYKLATCDTDGLKFYKEDGTAPSIGEIDGLLYLVNEELKQPLYLENDAICPKMVVVKSKNYVMKHESGEIEIKGSALKATMKERALSEFLDKTVNMLLDGQGASIPALYMEYVREILDVQDITRWASKKTITDKVLKPKRTNEQVILDAIGDKHVQEGDKIYVFYDTAKTLCLVENFKGVYDQDRLLHKLYATVKVLEPVVCLDEMPNFKLKKNKKLLEQI